MQGAIEDALSLVVRHDVDLICAGRTDRGVHALAQVVHADVDPPEERGRAALADLETLRERLDRMVGDAITIWRVAAVDEDFDARFSAVWRAYRYRLASRPADPRLRALVWHVPGSLDVAAMDAAATAVLGEHDYASFCRRAPGRTTMRRVLAADVTREGGDDGAGGDSGEVHVRIRGTAFCHQMVRAITGCLVEVGRGPGGVDGRGAGRAGSQRRRPGGTPARPDPGGSGLPGPVRGRAPGRCHRGVGGAAR